MTAPTPISTGRSWREGVPKVEKSWSPERREFNLIVRWPFYANLRLGMTQNALWMGRATDHDFTINTIFNRVRSA